jgi:hypothetical protein
MLQPSGIMFPSPTDVYHMISNEAVKTIVFAVCCLPLRPQSDRRFCKKHPVSIPARYEIKQIRYLLLLNMICDIPLDHEQIHPRKTNWGEDSVRLHLQCFHGKAGLHSRPEGSINTVRPFPPSWLRSAMWEVRAHRSAHGQRS